MKPLTKKERLVLQMMMEETSGNEIAKSLNLGLGQVEVLRKCIYNKTQSHGPIGLAKAAYKMGVLKTKI